MSKNINLIPINELNPYSLENCGLNKKPKLNEFKLWKQFVNHEFVQIKNKYINSSELNEYKWRLIIKYIIKSTHDFDFAKLVKDNHEKLFDFFQRYYNLKTIDVKNVKVSKEEKNNIMNTNEFKEFEFCFPNKLELIKIICHTQQLFDYIYFKHIINDKLQKMIKMEQDMNLLEISHQEYEIYYQNHQYVNIKIPKINVSNEFENEEFEKYIIKNIDTKTLLFVIVNNIVDIRNLEIFENKVIIMTTYHSFSISSLGQNSTKMFDQILFYKKMLKELLKRNDVNKCIDKYLELNLNASQLIELENLKKCVIKMKVMMKINN